ncbi:MAG TPA: N-acetylmuramoyl-L-alanine amidase [Candidatus Acidoferrales bacterium]|nr:N-acetylmuramoyl-L-alanine amidase [Candidatus Acidoferrales bacterium]
MRKWWLIGLPIVSLSLIIGVAARGIQNPQQLPPPPVNPPQLQPPAVQNVPAPPPRPRLAVVVIDPAHGGTDPGARGSTGINESDVTLLYSQMMRPALEAQGVRVIVTRENNADPSFDDRSAIVNGQRGAIFVTLHVASTGALGQVRVYSEPVPDDVDVTKIAGGGFPAHNGMLNWDSAQQFYAAASRRLAEMVQASLAQKFTGSPPAPFSAPIRQLRTVGAPAIAIEVSTVSTPERTRLIELGHNLADSVVRGVAEYRAYYEANVR